MCMYYWLYSIALTFSLLVFSSVWFGCCVVLYCIVFYLLLSAALKNALDWASRPPNVWAGKAAAIVSTGGGPGGGARAQYHLRQIGVFLDLHFINKPELMLSLRHHPRKFDDEGNLVDPQSLDKLNQLLVSLHDFALQLRGPRPCWTESPSNKHAWNARPSSAVPKHIYAYI